MLNQNLLLTGDDAYNLTKSLRFRSSASAYLNRTPASAGNLRMWTLSWWTKRGQLSTAAQTTMFGTDYASSQECQMQFTASNKFVLEQYAGGGVTNLGNLISTQVFRDPAAWYHIVVTWDTAQSTSSNRIKVYINGTQITAWDTASYPSQNADSIWNNSTNAQFIGKYSSAKHYDGYLAEVNFIDGQALTPSSFGQTSATTGVWIPKKYTGTYGTNGFYLPFTDVATTSGSNAGLGKDFSGNGNYWTTNNISVTSGSTYDSMKDVPTLTDTDTANYCVLNPLWKGSSITVDEANLKASATSLGSNQAVISSMFVSSGKWYFEYLQNTDSNSNLCVGIADTSFNATNNYVGGTATTYGYVAKSNYKFNNGSLTSYGTGSSANGDVLMCAFDLDNGKIYFGKNGTWYGSGDPAAGTNAAFTSISGTYCPAYSHNAGSSQSSSASFNFGQRPFAYTPPTGFKALNTFNLPTPTIGATASTQANKYFDATLYTGTGSSQSIVNSGSMQPDFVWTKSRSSASTHLLFDSIRGVYNYLISATTDAEGSLNTTLTAFNSNGFSVGSNSTINNNSSTNVAWQWKANGSGSSNTDGSITSTVSANPTAGFSIVTFTGNSTGGATVGHGLGVAPQLMFVKSRSNAYNWCVYAKAANSGNGQNGGFYLNLTDAWFSDSGFWNNTTAGSSTFTLGSGFAVNNSGSTYVAYCFSEVAGYSKFGSYTGNGSSDGPFVFTGFRPRWVMIKRTDTVESWELYDTSRSTYNTAVELLEANNSNAESTSSNNAFDILSNGFKLRGTRAATNASGGTFIYMAFAESPFKYALAR